MLLSQLAFPHHWFLLRDVYPISSDSRLHTALRITRKSQMGFTKMRDVSRFWYSLDGYV